MADHGNDVVDERAAAALEALRTGRPAQPAAPEVAATLRRWLERLGPVGIVGGFLAVAVVGALVWVALRPVGTPDGEVSLFSGSAATVPTGAAPGEVPAASTTTTSATVVVHAAGAVVAPGVYRLGPGLRVADLLAAAGGPTADADVDRLNLAATLADGQRLYVPRRGEVAPAAVAPDGGGAAPGSSSSGPGTGPSTAAPIDLNSADAEQLDALPGVGPATAAAIVDHRTRNGPFTSVDGLLDVRGIGPAKLEALRDLVTVG